MKRLQDLSVQKKLFLGMLGTSVFIVLIITGTAAINTYNAMREQLIYNRRMSIGWLKERLELELSGYQEQFYVFEINQEYKSIIQDWCIKGEELNYENRWSLITAMNEIISMDSSLNGIEIYNYKADEVLISKRSGASLEEIGDRLLPWEQRKDELQDNLVFLRTDNEILISHQMHRFSDNQPYALIVMHMRPYQLQDILSDIKMTADETVLVFNDEGLWIEADYGELSNEDIPVAQNVLARMKETQKTEIIWDGKFWFYREAGGGKERIILSVPDHVIIDSLKGTLMVAALVGIVAVALSVAGAALISRVFSYPIIRLSGKMRHFMLNDIEKDMDAEEETSEEISETQNEIVMLQESFNIMVDRNQRLIAQKYRKELEKREAQIRALRAQINPHFMYNVMQVIGGMALDRNAPEIYRVTTALGDLMRYCLNFSKEMVALREELHYLQSYCMLQNERFNDRIELEILVDDELKSILIPKLILQPILENSFHHGLVNQAGRWILKVQGEIREGKEGSVDTLILTVTDNGCGIAKERLAEIQENLSSDVQSALQAGAHIGLGNVNARIRLMYPEGDYGVFIDSCEGKGTTVVLIMEAKSEI